MNLETLQNTPPWDWPNDAAKVIEKILVDNGANESDRIVAAGLAGDYAVINDELATVLLTVLRDAGQPEQLRAKAAISFGAALEQADLDEFDDPDSVPISEDMFHNIQKSLHVLYRDETNPKEVRRRVLEASVRAPEKWHPDAIRTAYSSGDKEWVLTAVFSMQWVRGFDDQILEALESTDPLIRLEAVEAAGNWEIGAAWSHIAKLLKDPHTPKDLLIAAINASNIRPREAREILKDLRDSDDEEIAEAAYEAMMMATAMENPYEDSEDEEDEEEGNPPKWLH